MSGPALSRVESHHAIHESSRLEAQDLLHILEQAVARGDVDLATQVACLLCEHIQSRTLRHAQAEEEGLYAETAQAHADLVPLLCALKRDHDLMRSVVFAIEQALKNPQSLADILRHFHTFLWLEQAHSTHEEIGLIQTLEKRSKALPETAS